MECPMCQNSTRPEGTIPPDNTAVFYCYTCQKYMYVNEFGVHVMEDDEDEHLR